MAKALYSPEMIFNAAVAIDADKNSQFAVKWAVDRLNLNGFITLLHVKTQQNSSPQEDVPKEGRAPTKDELAKFFLPYRGFCARKGVRVHEVVLHDIDVARAIAEYVIDNSICMIVLGASSRSALARAFRAQDMQSQLIKSIPDFCAVYVVSKVRAQAVKSATRSPNASSIASSRQQPQVGYLSDTPGSQQLTCFIAPIESCSKGSWRSAGSDRSHSDGGSPAVYSDKSSRDFVPMTSRRGQSKNRSPQYPSPQHPLSSSGTDFLHLPPLDRQPNSKNISPPKTADSLQICLYNRNPGSKTPSNQLSGNNLNLHFPIPGSPSHSLSGSSDRSEPLSFQSSNLSFELLDQSHTSDASWTSSSSQGTGELEEEIKRLKQELKQSMEMYNSACRFQAREIDEWKLDEARRIEGCRQTREFAMIMVETEKHKCKAAIEAAQMAQRLAELESQKRKEAEMKLLHQAEEKKKAMDALAHCDIRYRKYSIEEIETATGYFSPSEKIGEGGYGPVYKAYLDHTAVAIKVLRSDISQGKKQFQREVEVLSHMRHPHMVLLLGACPEYGCLVYEYMENGSLEDRLFCRNGSTPLPWTIRFRIAAEIGTALLFLHQTRPEPIVHRDLKPANILLDRNYVSKIGDVGLSRLVPPSVADSVTQYHMTAAAGTFCYIDPEYQQTGMLCTKSDIYSFGVLLLQIITARTAMGLTYHVEEAIEHGSFQETLDPKVADWPVEDALSFAKLALKCCELRRRDRPDLGSVILPELERLRDLGSDAKAGSGNGNLDEAILHNQVSQESIPLSQVRVQSSPHFILSFTICPFIKA
ncbi:U-box domain-containing protein 35-like [Coffea eugenioides]|uniref:U-box domain-containing protein 35-like n=1 Tax=Coffea eugenioides TaxID=49369 RepID=UPI000F611FF3|nr:U-box domain-containing protein 35-like [Coffea eugenioides]